MSDFFTLELKNGDVFYANTHAELLNKIFGTHYKAWMKSVWRYSKTAFAWLIHIDGKSRNHFANTWLNKDTILQKYVGTDNIWNGEPLNFDAPGDHRLVFEMVGTWNRKYIFRGVFLMDRNSSTPRDMVFHRISDNFPIK